MTADDHVLVARVPVKDDRVSELRIVRNQDGFYLLHCNHGAEEIADTFHLTLGEAFAQAHFEFSIQPTDWLLNS